MNKILDKLDINDIKELLKIDIKQVLENRLAELEMKNPDLQKVQIESFTSFKDLSEKIGILDLKTLDKKHDNKVIEKQEIVKEEKTIIGNKYTKLLDKKTLIR
jgi:UDP-N-acetyl-D-mannosaminuronate dehydrogenase